MADVATYELCWCQGNCEHAAQFQYTIGTITLGGPLTNQMHLCYELQNCNVSHLSGWGLRKGDRLIVGDGDCREGVSIREGFPADGISYGSNDGHYYHFAPVTCMQHIKQKLKRGEECPPEALVSDKEPANVVNVGAAKGPEWLQICWCPQCTQEMARSRRGIPAGRIKVDTYREYMTLLQGLSGGEEWDPSESVRPLTFVLCLSIPGAACIGVLLVRYRQKLIRMGYVKDQPPQAPAKQQKPKKHEAWSADLLRQLTAQRVKVANENRVAPDALCQGDLPFFSGKVEEAYERCKLGHQIDVLDEGVEQIRVVVKRSNAPAPPQALPEFEAWVDVEELALKPSSREPRPPGSPKAIEAWSDKKAPRPPPIPKRLPRPVKSGPPKSRTYKESTV
jgi:hypothetical protein